MVKDSDYGESRPVATRRVQAELGLERQGTAGNKDGGRKTVVLRFGPNGLSTIYEQAEAALGRDVAALRQIANVKTRRASHVEPDEDGRWSADMSPMNGPILGPFDLRAEALRAETAWLEAHL